MNLPYFSAQDHSDLRSPMQSDLLLDKCAELQKALARRVRELAWDLHPYWERPHMVVGRCAAAPGACASISLPFLRSKEQAIAIERMMGRDGVSAPSSVDWRRHPVIELRITPEHVAIELVLSPTAWWDQRNLVGKVSVARHRDTLQSILAQMGGDFRFGFWDGESLSDAHLTSRQLARSGALHELMSTFGDGQDWLRVGVWYAPEDARLSSGTLVGELGSRLAALYPLYAYLLWTSSNNFHSFHPTNIWLAGGREVQA